MEDLPINDNSVYDAIVNNLQVYSKRILNNGKYHSSLLSNYVEGYVYDIPFASIISSYTGGGFSRMNMETRDFFNGLLEIRASGNGDKRKLIKEYVRKNLLQNSTPKSKVLESIPESLIANQLTLYAPKKPDVDLFLYRSVEPKVYAPEEVLKKLFATEGSVSFSPQITSVSVKNSVQINWRTKSNNIHGCCLLMFYIDKDLPYGGMFVPGKAEEEVWLPFLDHNHNFISWRVEKVTKFTGKNGAYLNDEGVDLSNEGIEWSVIKPVFKTPSAKSDIEELLLDPLNEIVNESGLDTVEKLDAEFARLEELFEAEIQEKNPTEKERGNIRDKIFANIHSPYEAFRLLNTWDLALRIEKEASNIEYPKVAISEPKKTQIKKTKKPKTKNPAPKVAPNENEEPIVIDSAVEIIYFDQEPMHFKNGVPLYFRQ